ncbi:hypothetical protein [Kribbella sp. NPDC004536]|uniref:hypothetical protein n=1 Tax=Kribbella sp. NPDC004536 TaxID=3364106 RepID=UPI0036782888
MVATTALKHLAFTSGWLDGTGMTGAVLAFALEKDLFAILLAFATGALLLPRSGRRTAASAGTSS